MRGLSPLLFLFLSLSVGVSVWSGHTASASRSPNAGQVIPDEAIRIRIIANSDSDADQAVKRKVRDRVAALIESWGAMPETIEESRALLRSHMREIQAAAERVLEEEGAGYGAVAELAKVPFPAKTFAGVPYPAGRYEALRITLGQGGGANWWCVLFPPLCLTAATADDPADAKAASAPAAGAAGGTDGKTAKAAGGQDEPKAGFFLLVLLEKLLAFIASLFS
ncbi:stage II sporulation protein R [Cohnella laeviribosi]|uniref:stage II sporulation protein R n=1 Tax=Cohnella laeviribosi TaxID=380174 RepID=UPI000361D4BC|nr:stage II sporulation protein R [Cohnella laeviribosi]